MPSEAINNFALFLNNAAAEVTYSLSVGAKPDIAYVGSSELTSEDLSRQLAANYCYKSKFSGVPDGRVYLAIPTGLALSLAASLMGMKKSESLQASEKSALFELMNNLTGRWAIIWGETLGREVLVNEQDLLDPGSQDFSPGEKWIQMDFGIAIGNEDFLLKGFIPLQVADIIEAKINRGASVQKTDEVKMEEPESEMTEVSKPPMIEKPKEELVPERTESVPAREKIQAPPTQKAPPRHTPQETPVNVRQAQLQQLQAEKIESGPDRSIDMILDVPLLISVELGRKDLTIKEILELSPGSLIELNQLAGEPVDLLINGKLFARGEVVVIDENFGIRVTHIISPQERVEKLR